MKNVISKKISFPVGNVERSSRRVRSLLNSKEMSIIKIGACVLTREREINADLSFSFVCEHCRSNLIDQNFYEKNEQFLCHACLEQIEPCLARLPTDRSNSDRCQRCGEEFLDGQSIALYHYELYHQRCFYCVQCRKSLINQGFFRHEDGCLYCLTCQIDLGPHCSICDEPFATGDILCQFDGKPYHQNCFQCHRCRQTIETKRFRCEQGQIICEFCSTSK